jgi:hypothetical protein
VQPAPVPDAQLHALLIWAHAALQVEESDLQQENLSLRTQFRRLKPLQAGVDGTVDWTDELGDTPEGVELARAGAENRALRAQLAQLLAQPVDGEASGDLSMSGFGVGGGERAREMRDVLRKNLARVRVHEPPHTPRAAAITACAAFVSCAPRVV